MWACQAHELDVDSPNSAICAAKLTKQRSGTRKAALNQLSAPQSGSNHADIRWILRHCYLYHLWLLVWRVLFFRH